MLGAVEAGAGLVLWHAAVDMGILQKVSAVVKSLTYDIEISCRDVFAYTYTTRRNPETYRAILRIIGWDSSGSRRPDSRSPGP